MGALALIIACFYLALFAAVGWFFVWLFRFQADQHRQRQEAWKWLDDLKK